MRLARLPAGALLALLLGCGCAWWPFGGDGRHGDPSHGVEVVSNQGIEAFYGQAQTFYDRLALRRVDTYATYQDRVLREYFQTPEAFADYYADLAADLADAFVEKSRPLSVVVDEFILDGPGRARVRVRIVGEDGKPLRPGHVELEREDTWERIDGRWWLVPGKL